MNTKNRRKFTNAFKTKVVLDALKETNTIKELSKKYGVHPTQINTWKREFISKASKVFDDSHSIDKSDNPQDSLIKELYTQIGKLTVSLDFLKKKKTCK
ncbi:MAG: transposase [Phycisphaerales bacterium]|nr:transposase [Phycisphaerales bacterium]